MDIIQAVLIALVLRTPAVEGMNDDSASQQLFGSQGYDESSEEVSSTGLELLCP